MNGDLSSDELGCKLRRERGALLDREECLSYRPR
jgi:hypothetical protein